LVGTQKGGKKNNERARERKVRLEEQRELSPSVSLQETREDWEVQKEEQALQQ